MNEIEKLIIGGSNTIKIGEFVEYASEEEVREYLAKVFNKLNEVIEKITVDRTEVGQIIKIYNKYESKPQVFINKTKTNHTEIYWMINGEGEGIDISDEYKPRYSRTNH